jgi:guanylate cyclase
MEETVVKKLLGWLAKIGSDPADDRNTALQKRLVLALSLVPVPAGVIWTATYLAVGAGPASWIPFAYTVIATANTALFAAWRSLAVYRFSQLLLTLLLPLALSLGLGGFGPSAAVVLWSALCPLAALLLGELRRATGWFLGFVGALAVSVLAEPYLVAAPLSETVIRLFFAMNLGAVIGIAFILLYQFVRQRNYFEERSEQLLLNILPKEIAEALREGVRRIAAQHDQVSILFADAVDFTPLTASLEPKEVVEILEEVFDCFDLLVEKYDLEKIKTIGDCYMAAAGVPRPRPDHAEALAGLAVDMRDAVAGRLFHGHRLTFRIGINSGTVVAGVIGRKKFIYDLWGDAVNLASRMESHGTAGSVQVTAATAALIADAFECVPRGRIAVKGSGELDVWHVVGRRNRAGGDAEMAAAAAT